MRLGLSAPAVLFALACATHAYAQTETVADHRSQLLLPSPADLDSLCDALSQWSPSSFGDALARGSARAASCTLSEATWTCEDIVWSFRHPVLGDVEVSATSMSWQDTATHMWSDVTLSPAQGWRAFATHYRTRDGGRRLEGLMLSSTHHLQELSVASSEDADGVWVLSSLQWEVSRATAMKATEDRGTGWTIEGLGPVSAFDTSTGHVGGVLVPTARYAAGVVEVEGNLVLGDTGLTLTGWVAPTSHYGMGLTWLDGGNALVTRPLTAGVIVTQSGEVGTVTHGGLSIGSPREHVSGWIESDSTGASVQVGRVGRESFRDTLRRSVGVASNGSGHALRLWATSDEGPGTPAEDHYRAILDAALRLGGNEGWTDVSIRSEVATGEEFEHITDASLVFGGMLGSRGAAFLEGALSPIASVDVTRYPNGLTASSHGAVGADVRAGLDMTGQWDTVRHRVLPTIRATITPLRFGVAERSTRQDRMSGVFVKEVAQASLKLDQEWSDDTWSLRVPLGAWAGVAAAASRPTMGLQGGIAWRHPVLEVHGDVFVEPSSSRIADWTWRHDARLTLRPGRAHTLSVWSGDTTRRDVQRQRWIAAPLGGMAAASSIDHVLVSSARPHSERLRHGVTWGLDAGGGWWPRLDVDGYVAPWEEDTLEFGAAAGLNWERKAEGVTLGVRGAYSVVHEAMFMGVQAGLNWAL